MFVLKSANKITSWEHALWFEIIILLFPISISICIYLLFTDPSMWIWPSALLPALLRHGFYLIRLTRLMQRRQRLAPPVPYGLWGEIWRSIIHYQQRGRKGRKRLIRFTKRFREAANAVPDALIILDKYHRIEWANPAATRLLNIHWPADDGQHLPEVIPNEELNNLLATEEYTRSLEIALDHNRAMMLALRCTPFGGRKKQRLIVGRDITKIYHLDMIRRDFVANTSHELRTPLTVITGFIETLIDAPGILEIYRRPLNLMRKQADRMCSIVEDLLTLSRLDMQEDNEDSQVVEVPDELYLILQEAQALSNGQHIFFTQIDENLLLLGSQPELRSAFTNLIINAVRHTPAGTKIKIVWERSAENLCFRVQDDGPGIAQEHLPRLTERFYRVDRARSRASGGTGLGLAIVKHVLNRHGARLTIASQLGQGTIFTCYFPAERVRQRQLLPVESREF